MKVLSNTRHENLNKKEALGYTYHNERNIYEEKANIKQYKKHLKGLTIEQIKENKEKPKTYLQSNECNQFDENMKLKNV